MKTKYIGNEPFDTVVSSKNKIFNFNVQELIDYRDLIFLLVKREFISKYKQTILGPLWAIIQPVLTSVVFTIVFGTLAKLTTADTAEKLMVPSFLFYMSGTIIWSYFSNVINSTSNTFIANSNIMGKVYFPRLAVPIATAIANLISLGIQFVLFVGMYVFCIADGSAHVTLHPASLLLLPLIVLQVMLLSMSIGIIISSLTTKYRDLAMLVSFGLQLWQYGTPIAYGLMMIPAKWIGLYLLNPITPCILTFRYMMFGTGYFNISYYGISWGITLVLVLIGILLFNRIEKTFMDTI